MFKLLSIFSLIKKPKKEVPENKICPNENCPYNKDISATTSHFCFKCGSEMKEKKQDRCPKCGNIILPFYNFCTKCREVLKETKSSEIKISWCEKMGY